MCLAYLLTNLTIEESKRVMKKADERKESLFIEHYVECGNAKESAIASGYNEKSASSMGYYLKQKFTHEIRDKLTEKMNGITAKGINVLIDLLDCEQPAVRLKSAQFILQANGYADQNINMNINKTKNENKTDEQLKEELMKLIEENPTILPKGLKLVN